MICLFSLPRRGEFERCTQPRTTLLSTQAEHDDNFSTALWLRQRFSANFSPSARRVYLCSRLRTPSKKVAVPIHLKSQLLCFFFPSFIRLSFFLSFSRTPKLVDTISHSPPLESSRFSSVTHFRALNSAAGRQHHSAGCIRPSFIEQGAEIAKHCCNSPCSAKVQNPDWLVRGNSSERRATPAVTAGCFPTARLVCQHEKGDQQELARLSLWLPTTTTTTGHHSLNSPTVPTTRHRPRIEHPRPTPHHTPPKHHISIDQPPVQLPPRHPSRLSSTTTSTPPTRTTPATPCTASIVSHKIRGITAPVRGTCRQ